jgi:hypothetical protein
MHNTEAVFTILILHTKLTVMTFLTFIQPNAKSNTNYCLDLEYNNDLKACVRELIYVNE